MGRWLESGRETDLDDNTTDGSLLLPDLHIENFRGIQNLSIPQLGRVTLLAGRNGVGKTTVLEAIQVFAARARYSALEELLYHREEISVGSEEDGGNTAGLDWRSLFYGRHTALSNKVVIGPTQNQNQLKLESTGFADLSAIEIGSLPRYFPGHLDGGETHTLRAHFQEDSWIVPALLFPDQPAGVFRDRLTNSGNLDERRMAREFEYLVRRGESRLPRATTCEKVGPGLISNSALARFWDTVALTEDEKLATYALNLIFRDEVLRVAVVGDDRPGPRKVGRRAIVRLESSLRPVPLRSLGDGALRLFGVALALANSRDGFLLIDEAENGIHHTVQRDYWRMVLQTAHENNVQVFATTHSWDCVRGFAQAALDSQDVEGVVVRLEKEEDGLRAVRYSEHRLSIAAEQGIEVR